MDYDEIIEELFEAINAIVTERIRNLGFDKTVIATIIDNSKAAYGRYTVTTDENITFYAYTEVTTYPLNERVYVRIPENDYTKQKVITGRFIPDNLDKKVTETKSQQVSDLRTYIQSLLGEKGE